ncbi:MAG: hypothetical protein QXK76_02160 [Candidatus Woesearchaeota archaeon]
MENKKTAGKENSKEYMHSEEESALEREIKEIIQSKESSIILSSILTGMLLKDRSLLNSNKVVSYVKDKFGVYGFKIYNAIKDSYLESKNSNIGFEGEKNE